MASSFFGLNIASSGMSAYRAYLNTTAHNIANAKTEGYTKQSCVQTSKIPIATGTSYGMIGAGTEVTDIISKRDDYYDYKYRKSTSVYGYYETASYYMKSIEDYLYSSETESASLSNSLDKFFNSLTYLSTDPTNNTIRAEATGYADSLGTFANEMVRNLKEMQKDLNSQISTTISQVNAYAEQIASLTKQINQLEVYGNKANDLRDQRANIIDKLSELANIDVVEQEPFDGNGVRQFIVSMGGSVLVDTYAYNTLEVIPMDTYYNQSDASDLYDVRWNNGQRFATRSTTLGGKLQALFEVRDGNNGENFKADIVIKDSDGYALKSGDQKLKLEAPFDAYSTASDISKLNIPASHGIITIGNREYEYSKFEVTVDKDGKYYYEFDLEKNITAEDVTHITKIKNANEKAQIGVSVEYRGIPYYMSQLNEFIRTFSATFNQQQNAGYDLNGVQNKKDLFVANDIVSDGVQHDMIEFRKNTTDGYYYLNGSKVFAQNGGSGYITSHYNDTNKYEVSSGVSKTINGINYSEYTIKNKENGEIVESVLETSGAEIFKFSSSVGANESASYYNMTGSNFAANQELVKDGKLLAAATKDPTKASGVAEGGNLKKMIALQEDNTMFKQGTPTSFLQVMTASVGVDSQKMISQTKVSENIRNSIANRRLSTAGVDEDEEAQMLIETQNLLNAQYRVISVMNEVLDKLINQMGY